jgi:hypothetical protein
MKELKTGRLLPVEPDRIKAVYDAFKALSSNPAFRDVLALIESRLTEVDSSNRQRGNENQYTEAQAWSWFLAVASNATEKGEQKTIELQV